jgi:hypothetical protein
MSVRLYAASPLAGDDIKFIAHDSLMRCAAQWPIKHEAISGCHIPYNRAILVQRFLEQYPEATHLLFVDTDMGFHPSDVQLLLDADVDCIGALYVIKNEKRPPCFRPMPDRFVDERGVLEVERVATGLMLLKRELLESMVRHFEALRMDHDGTMIVDLFSPMPGVRKTDDYAFCDRVREMGRQVHLHTHARVVHRGAQNYYVPENVALPLRPPVG